jgi:hypothetical protein
MDSGKVYKAIWNHSDVALKMFTTAGSVIPNHKAGDVMRRKVSTLIFLALRTLFVKSKWASFCFSAAAMN